MHHNTKLQKNIGSEMAILASPEPLNLKEKKKSNKKLLDHQIFPKIRFPTEDIVCDCVRVERERERERENVYVCAYCKLTTLSLYRICRVSRLNFLNVSLIGGYC